MRTAVVTFPGSNCDDDLIHAFKNVCQFETIRLWHKDSPDLGNFDLVALPGGFSYGDYLRCGAIASVSPIMEKVKEFADKGGLVLGVCNGFQILTESRLLPGALALNNHRSFRCLEVNLKITNVDSPWTNGMKINEEWVFPIAHGEGRYVVDPEELSKMQSNGQILLTYKENPNGSTQDIAGVCNTKKNVFGLMPHPERATDLRSKDGQKLWSAIARYLKGIT